MILIYGDASVWRKKNQTLSIYSDNVHETIAKMTTDKAIVWLLITCHNRSQM